jgi:hypothetical protein
MHDSRCMTTQPVTPGWVADDGTFGARLALIRQRMGWGNVREAALACGLPVESWRGWERDGRLPRDLITVGRAISSRTGCNLGWLVGMADGGQGGPGARVATDGHERASAVTREYPPGPGSADLDEAA